MHGGFVKFVVGAMDPVPNAIPAIAGVKPVLPDENSKQAIVLEMQRDQHIAGHMCYISLLSGNLKYPKFK